MYYVIAYVVFSFTIKITSKMLLKFSRVYGSWFPPVLYLNDINGNLGRDKFMPTIKGYGYLKLAGKMVTHTKTCSVVSLWHSVSHATDFSIT